MRITCPACAAGYNVPDAMLGGGRSVRCVRCLREWQPAHPAPSVPDLPPEGQAAWPGLVPPSPVAVAAPDDLGLFEAPDEARPRFGAPDSEAPAPAAPSMPHPPAAARRPADGQDWRGVLLAREEPDPGIEAAGRSDGWIGWAASLVLLAALVWTAIAYRAEVQRAWPPSTRLYTALGVHAPP